MRRPGSDIRSRHRALKRLWNRRITSSWMLLSFGEKYVSAVNRIRFWLMGTLNDSAVDDRWSQSLIMRSDCAGLWFSRRSGVTLISVCGKFRNPRIAVNKHRRMGEQYITSGPRPFHVRCSGLRVHLKSVCLIPRSERRQSSLSNGGSNGKPLAMVISLAKKRLASRPHREILLMISLYSHTWGWFGDCLTTFCMKWKWIENLKPNNKHRTWFVSRNYILFYFFILFSFAKTNEPPVNRLKKIDI